MNPITVNNTYSLPYTDEYLGVFGVTEIFCGMDAGRGYMQIAIFQRNRDNNNFIYLSVELRLKGSLFKRMSLAIILQRNLELSLAG